MLVNWMPQPPPVEERAPAAPVLRPAPLEDDWSNVTCCSAMRPRPRPPGDRQARRPDRSRPDDAPPVEHYA
jgi:hypothetical protein